MQWRLYNIGEDPGETADLSVALPDLYREMQAQYEAFVRDKGVLPMPDNYSVAKQVLINMIVFTYLPKYLPYFGGFLVLAGMNANNGAALCSACG
jgi:hypothetical protein